MPISNIEPLIDVDENFLLTQNTISSLLPSSSGTSYIVFTISGPQSSGKSTLLNHLFSTSFTTLDMASSGFQRTTEGINMCVLNDTLSYKMPVIILDAEGTDSSSRAGDSHVFENKIALFSLSISNVFFCNMWFRDIGRYSASGASLLKNIMEISISTFEQNKKIWLIFVVRDYNSTLISESKIKEIIIEQTNLIFGNIKNNKNIKNINLENIFEIDFLLLPDYYRDKNDFLDKVDDFKLKFQNKIIRQLNNPSYLVTSNNSLNSSIDDKDENKWLKGNVPGSEVYNWWFKIWNKIKNHKDLNLPAERQLVSIIKCKNIKEKEIKRFTNKIGEIKELKIMKKKIFEKNDEKVEEGLRKVSKVFKRCFEGYLEDTKWYDEEIKNEYLNLFLKDISHELKFSYDYLIEFYKHKLVEWLAEYNQNELYNNLQQVLTSKKDSTSEEGLKIDLNETVIPREKEDFFENFFTDLTDQLYARTETFSKAMTVSIQVEKPSDSEEKFFEKLNVLDVTNSCKLLFSEHLLSYKANLTSTLISHIKDVVIKNFTYNYIETKLKSMLLECPTDINQKLEELQTSMYEEIQLILTKSVGPLFYKPDTTNPNQLVIFPNIQSSSYFQKLKFEKIKSLNKSIIEAISNSLVQSLRLFIKVSFHSRLTQIFDKNFLFNEDRLPIYYSSIEKSRSAFKTAQTVTLNTLTIYKNLSIISLNPSDSGELILKRDINFIHNEAFDELKEKIMQYMSMKTVELERTINNRNKNSDKIYWILIGLIIILGWNEMWFLLKNPFLTILVVLIAGIFWGIKKVQGLKKYFEGKFYEEIIRGVLKNSMGGGSESKRNSK